MSEFRMKARKDDVLIVGVGLTAVAEHWDRSLRELALEAITTTLGEAYGIRPQALFVANMLAPALTGQSQLGALLADFAGLRGIEALTVEAAGASGGMAVRQAYLALAGGELQAALVVGAEKVSDHPSAELGIALTSASDVDYETVHGITPMAQAAMIMRRYLHEHQAPPDALAGFSINAHANAASNPKAIYQRPITEESYQKAPMVSEPLNMFDAAPLADGAAALLLVRAADLPADLPHPPVRIAASASAIASLALHDRPDPLALDAARESAAQAFQRAGVSPDDIDLFELHDVFSIYAALALEAAGFAEPGAGWKLSHNGTIARTGSIPICTFGGSKARGDTGGATGVYQIAEATLQLQSRAGPNQIPDARIAMTQCLGGSGATAVTHLLQTETGHSGQVDSS
jgi:acetyl-CoA C-acetyltransferase